MSVLVEFSMFPTDKGQSVSNWVARIIKAIDETGIPYQLTPMGTIFETETMEEALAVIFLAHSVLEDDCKRIYTNIKMDIRKGKSGRMIQKIVSVKSKMGKK